MRYYVDGDIGSDFNIGTQYAPFLTMQKGISVCGTGDEVLLSADTFAAQNIDLSAVAAGYIKITANRGTRVTIDALVPGTALLMIQNGEWHFGVRANIGVNTFNPATRSILFDNATVHLDREKNNSLAYSFVNPQVFYHCDLIINCAIHRHVMLCCDIDINQDSYWYNQSDFYCYHNHIIMPDGMTDYRVPLFDKIGFANLIADIYKNTFYTRGMESRTSEFIYGFESLYAPLNSMNGVGIKAGPDVAAKNTDGSYADDDWAYLFGSLILFRDQISLGTKVGTTRQNPAMIWMNSVDKWAGDTVFPASGSTGKYYRCTIGGTTAATEPAWSTIGLGETIVDGTVTWLCISPNDIVDDPVAEMYDTPNFIERYLKNLYDDSFILNEKLLYYQGILNGQYGAEGFSFNYERFGIDIKSVLAFNVSETWNVAGSMLAMLSMTECDNCASAIQEFNKKRNFPIGRIPFYFDIVAHELRFHRRVSEWTLNTAIRIGTILYIPDGLDAWYEFECTGEGTTGAVQPAWDLTYLNYTPDNTVTWRCFGPVATPAATAPVDYGDEIEGAMATQDKTATELGVDTLLVASDTYSYRSIYNAYDYIHRHYEDDYTMAAQRQTNEQVMAVGDIVVGWNYIYLDLTDGVYKNTPNAALKILFDLYLRDTRKKDRVPMAMIRFINDGVMGFIVAQVIMLHGGVLGYNAVPGPLLPINRQAYVSWPNNLLSYATASRGGFVMTEFNTGRDDAIIENLFRQVFAVDTELYRSTYIKDWYEYAGKTVQVGQLVRATGTAIAETRTFICTVAGTAGAVFPGFAGAPAEGDTVVDGAVTWTNLGYMAFAWRQIENP